METYNGHVRTPQDAIILFEACRLGELPRVQRRLSEKERQQIKSGSVFVWDEKEAGMRRWTDGKSWSASRVSGSFLTYREMEGKRGGSTLTAGAQLDTRKTPDRNPTRPASDSGPESGDDGPDGYRYKPDGLMKQSFSITNSRGDHLHLISYFARTHPAASHLNSPSSDPVLRHIHPPKGMYPESTVQEQQNIPAVTRTPLQTTGYPTMPQTAAYARNGFAPHPQSHPPGPHQGPPRGHHPGYWPLQAPSPNGHGQPDYMYHYPPSNPGVNPARPQYQQPAHPSHPPHPPSSTYPHQPFLSSPANPEGRHPTADPYHRSPGAYGDTLPPPAAPRHHRNSSSGSTRSFYDSSSSQHTTPMVQQPTPPTPLQQSFDSSSNPTTRPAPRLRVPSPNGQALPPLSRTASIDLAHSRSPSPLPLPRSSLSERKASGETIPHRPSVAASDASTRPSIGALMNANGSTRAEPDGKSDRSTSKSPGMKEEGGQYMASDKVVYSGEDQRALRQLDRAFRT